MTPLLLVPTPLNEMDGKNRIAAGIKNALAANGV